GARMVRKSRSQPGAAALQRPDPATRRMPPMKSRKISPTPITRLVATASDSTRHTRFGRSWVVAALLRVHLSRQVDSLAETRSKASPMTIVPLSDDPPKPDAARKVLLAAVALVAVMTGLRAVYASLVDLRTDEAYYWTFSKENVLCFLDHPPMIAWFIRAGTAMFGDSNYG